ncbi:MAG: hypothetical protein ACRET3_10915, partial [Burkholderiales bacterium]
LTTFVSSPELRVRKLFLSHTNDIADMKPNVDALVAALQNRRDSVVSWTTRGYSDETHNTDVLKGFYDGLRAVFSGYDYPRDATTNRLVGSLEDMKTHFAEFGGRLGIAFAPPEEIVHELAAGYLATDSVQLAVTTLRFNVSQHPESPNAWRRLGIGLERAGQRTEALEAYRKGLAVAERQGLQNLEPFRQAVGRLAPPR